MKDNKSTNEASHLVHSVQRQANAVGSRILRARSVFRLCPAEKRNLSVAHGRCPSCNPAEGRPKFLFACARSKGKRHDFSASRVSPDDLFSPSRSKSWPCANKSRAARRLALVAIALVLGVPCSTRAAGPEGQLTWAVHVTLAPTWFDPAETSGIITPYMMLYAIHDAMVKPMPGNSLAPSLAESVTISDDKLTYDMTIRKGAKFHDGTPVTAEDVKFSFERYRGCPGGADQGPRRLDRDARSRSCASSS